MDEIENEIEAQKQFLTLRKNHSRYEMSIDFYESPQGIISIDGFSPFKIPSGLRREGLPYIKEKEYSCFTREQLSQLAVQWFVLINCNTGISSEPVSKSEEEVEKAVEELTAFFSILLRERLSSPHFLFI
ncbi:hypothetical protein [Lactococcus muris]|uniref:hypothetical protein n=1 Tax=Lactococcus muris TaxID=2941330 RepID=UPI002300F9DA